ncbi:putative drug exporter of the RND superfamily [Streptomyces sp. WMMB 714]|uniref:MMPL family transporter n=1 Tax=Streptomyces sp. WMMB 714 TaxID=1286822 RepID=UPI0005F7AA55|nr:MMPL family transporter [Streptomyces sp. WMMB 714]SCK29033.1 putative drug exporter of the RND superfamily [Streptomyces sp. WMMB 714]
MFSALGSALHARRRVSLLLAVLAAIVAGYFGGSVESRLTNGLSDYDDPHGPNVAAREVIESATGVDAQQGYAVLVRTGTRLDAGDAAPREVTAAARMLRERPEVKRVVDFSTAGDAALISEDGRSTVVMGAVRPMTDAATIDAEKKLQQAIEDDPALRGKAWLGGPTPGHVQVAEVSNEDLATAEGLAFPVILVLLFLVFRGVVAALVPLIGSVVSLLLTFAGLRLATGFMDVSTGALSLAFALGLGLSVDFGLLIVSRYREEIAQDGPGAEALRRTVATAGRTVLFSALTVAAALAALMVFPQPYLRSMGLAGVVTVISAAAFALLGLPALLAVLGSRINSLAPRRWQRAAGAGEAAGDRWHRIACAVMRRPAVLAVVATAVLLAIASPVAGARFTGADAGMLPAGTSAGHTAQVLERDFEEPATSPLQIVLDTPRGGAELAAYRAEIADVPGVRDVGRPFRLDGGHWEIDAVLAGAPLGNSAQDAARAVQALDAPHQARYTGLTADLVAQQDSITDRLPLAAGVLSLVTLLLLFAFSGSVLLPLTALLMNLLSTGAALGFLVWVFQGGNLGFTAQSGIETTTPVLVFALAFGLSTDYNVFLLGRIREARASGLDDRAAVAEGLARTGPIVTSAALLFCVAVGALALGRLVLVQELGLGTAFAVLIDATLVRALLVPSLMALLGRTNWWAPAPLRSLHRALRLDRMEPPGRPPSAGEVTRAGGAADPPASGHSSRPEKSPAGTSV